MPIPTPRKDEGRKAFLSRCMANKVMNREFPNNKQRYAVCNSSWRKKKIEKVMEVIKAAFARLLNNL